MTSDSKKPILSDTISTAILLGLAAIFRFADLHTRSLWLDEATSLTVARQTLAEILHGAGFDSHTPPLYYILLHCWIAVVPANEAGLRLLSAFFDILNIWLVLLVFSKQFSRRIGMTAAVIYATAPFAIYYAQEARMYSLLIFMGLVTYYCALRFLEIRKAGTWQLLLILISIAGLYTHYYYAFFVASISLGLLFVVGTNLRSFLHWLLPLCVTAICFLPWLRVVLHLASGPGQTFRRFVLTVPGYAFFRFTAGYAVMPMVYGMKDNLSATFSMWLPMLLPYFLVFGGLFLAGFRKLLRRRQSVLIYAALVGPPLISFLLAANMNILSERYWCISYPYFVVLFAILPWGELRPRGWLFIQVFAVALWIAALVSHYTNPAFGFADWRGAAEIASREKNPLILIRPGFNRNVFEYYYGKSNSIVEVRETELITTVLLELSTRAAVSAAPIVLVETGDLPSMASDLRHSGYQVQSEHLLPYENGIRVVIYKAQALLGRAAVG